MAQVTTADGVRIDSIASNPHVSGRLPLDPGAREEVLALLSPAGHFANRDQPEAFNRAVLDLLAGLGA
jgi:pimeloyl-ACP methyl ester carboxylesterase